MARHDVADALAATGFSDPGLHLRVALAVSEAATNVVRHAYAHPGDEHMEISVAETAEGFVVAITDHGVGMDTDIGFPGIGLGLPLMHAQSTKVEIDSNTTGTTVTLHFQAD
jgi:anti-sigma regulatory factor (Ser/Thr protein kinase)